MDLCALILVISKILKMADEEAGPTIATPPLIVEYDKITGVPPEYNECLPKDSDEYKRWKAHQQGGQPPQQPNEGSAAEGVEGLSIAAADNKDVGEIEKKLPGGKVKRKAKPQILMACEKRQGKKMTTSVAGLEHFGVKLSDAAKVFGKKFACGESDMGRRVAEERCSRCLMALSYESSSSSIIRRLTQFYRFLAP